MPIIVLDLLKYAFLAVLYIFIWLAVRAIYRELRAPVGGAVAPRAAAKPAPSSSKRVKQIPRKAVVVEGDGVKGKSLSLGQEILIGRADKCNLKLEDTYVSQVHARIYPHGEKVMVEDMGSTNGTYLNRKRITAPNELLRGDQLKIGRIVMEMRK